MAIIFFILSNVYVNIVFVRQFSVRHSVKIVRGEIVNGRFTYISFTNMNDYILWTLKKVSG